MCSYLQPFVQRLSEQFYELNVKHSCVVDGYVKHPSTLLAQNDTITNPSIADQNLAQQSVVYEDDQVKSSFDQSVFNQGFWVLNIVDGNVEHSQNDIIWSQELRNLLGYERKEDFPDGWDSWLSAVHPDDVDSALKLFNQYVKNNTANTAFVAKYRLRHASGQYIWIREQANTIRNDKGLLVKSLGSIRDISTEINIKP